MSNYKINYTFDASPSADGTVIEVRRTTWKQRVSMKTGRVLDSKPIDVGTVAELSRDEAAALITDLARSLSV